MQTGRLASIGDQLSNWSQTPLHPLFPVGALGLIHAVRVSHATRQVAGSHKSRLGVWQGLVLNQILMFGGVVISGMLLGIPSPLLSAWPVVALYGGVHVALDVTPAGKALLHAQDVELVGTLMDLSFALLDGILRAEGIIDLGVEPVLRHASRQVATSLFAVLLNAAIVGGGIPLLIDLFRLDSTTGEWGVRSPAWAKNPFSGTNDMLSSAFLALVYLTLASPATAPIALLRDALHAFGAESLDARDVRTLCSLLLGSILLSEKATVLSNQQAQHEMAKNGSVNGNTKSKSKSARKLQ
ncbi:uncharacterized protein PSANT_02951 [Moesziomyces antarcticus]|nr:uncharacterized protein PSANT_02951 [Moesziomyces antarcticus]